MSRNPLVEQLILTSLVAFLFVVSLLGFAVGIGLIARSPAMLRFIGVMNRWVSTRRALKPLEVPRNIEVSTSRGGRWLGLALVVLGAYSFVVLALKIGAYRVGSPLAGIAIDFALWFLIVGSFAGVATGILLLFFPGAWRSVELHANRWYSTRRLVAAGDTMHLPLERIVEAFPRTSGCVIGALSLVSTVASGLLLFSGRI
jgi:hypothetical protein